MKVKTSQAYEIIAPRPTVLITTLDENGNANVAPYSFVMPVSIDPPVVGFSSALERDTLHNVRATNEFVLNIPGKELLKEVGVCAKSFPPGTDEAIEAGLSEETSEKVSPPRIKECIGWIECRVKEEITVGNRVIVIGEVLAAAVKEGLTDETGKPMMLDGNPLLHVAGPVFAVGGEVRLE